MVKRFAPNSRLIVDIPEPEPLNWSSASVPSGLGPTPPADPIERDSVRSVLQDAYEEALEGVNQNRRAPTRVFAYTLVQIVLQRVAHELGLTLYP